MKIVQSLEESLAIKNNKIHQLEEDLKKATLLQDPKTAELKNENVQLMEELNKLFTFKAKIEEL